MSHPPHIAAPGKVYTRLSPAPGPTTLLLAVLNIRAEDSLAVTSLIMVVITAPPQQPVPAFPAASAALLPVGHLPSQGVAAAPGFQVIQMLIGRRDCSATSGGYGGLHCCLAGC